MAEGEEEYGSGDDNDDGRETGCKNVNWLNGS